ncbi:MAG: DUF5320 domain-containing protein, partial [Candidatus Hydrogenedentota bacterium]
GRGAGGADYNVGQGLGRNQPGFDYEATPTPDDNPAAEAQSRVKALEEELAMLKARLRELESDDTATQ